VREAANCDMAVAFMKPALTQNDRYEEQGSRERLRLASCFCCDRAFDFNGQRLSVISKPIEYLSL